MLSRAHEVLLALVADDPTLLAELVERLLGKTIVLPPDPTDSAVRSAVSAEVRPDLLFVDEGRGWTALEVQRRVDRDKPRRWALLVGVLLDRHHVLGDLFVLTAAPHVARWARAAVGIVSPSGTRLRLTPVVIALYGRNLPRLLDPGRPRLAFFAAWSVHHRFGPAARRIVARALEVACTLPEPLRTKHVHGILEVLNDRLHQHFAETDMLDIDQELERLEPPWLRDLRLRLEARGATRGKREALLTIFQARGFVLSATDRARIDACKDLDTLDRWIAGAASAASIEGVLGPARPEEPGPAPRRARRPPRRRALRGTPA